MHISELIAKRRDANIPVKFDRIMTSSRQEMDVDDEKRRIVGYASTFGNKDWHDDVVMPGAFKKTIAERMPQKLIKFFQDHWFPVGMPESMKEDEVGLMTETLVTSQPAGDSLLTMIKEGIYAHMSIGYDVIRGEEFADEETGEEHDKLKEIRLWEYSSVIWPANEQAAILGVKSVDEAEDLAHRLRAGLDFYRGKGIPLEQQEVFRRAEDVLTGVVEEIRSALIAPEESAERPVTATRELDEVVLQELAALTEKLQSSRSVFATLLPTAVHT